MSKTQSTTSVEPAEVPILETQSLQKSFGALQANDNISFSVTPGEIRGLIGPNGSGKSTFFNTVTGFYKPDGGSVHFKGSEITGWKPHKIAQHGLVRTFQITTPFEELTVRDNLFAVPSNKSRSEQIEHADEILTFLEIDHLADDKAKEMSGGQQKLLELARALMLEPDCIMLDEPMAGVNPALQARILDHIREMNNNGTAFVIIEHDMDMIKEIADTVSVFDQGSHIAQGEFDEVQADPRVRTAYLGTGDEDAEGTTEPESKEVSTNLETSVARTEDKTRTDRSTQPTLVGEDIVTGYGAHEVVHGVTIESQPGVVCILGPNGSGKSTTMKALNGQVPVWSGSVTYGNVDLTEKSVLETIKHGIVTLPQEGGVLGTLSVEDNLKLGASNVLDDEDQIAANLERVLEEFPVLKEKLNDKAGSLSGGQQMMVSFGRAMMTDADIYLLDEPTAGLAPALVDDVLSLIEMLVADGAQVVLIEQNVKAALKVSHYVYILAQGSLQFEGTPDELTDEDELMDIYLGL